MIIVAQHNWKEHYALIYTQRKQCQRGERERGGGPDQCKINRERLWTGSTNEGQTSLRGRVSFRCPCQTGGRAGPSRPTLKRHYWAIICNSVLFLSATKHRLQKTIQICSYTLVQTFYWRFFFFLPFLTSTMGSCGRRNQGPFCYESTVIKDQTFLFDQNIWTSFNFLCCSFCLEFSTSWH